MHKPISLVTINHCQLRCNFCLNSKLKNKFECDEYSYDHFVEIVNKCVDYGINSFELTPSIGDVFLDSNIIDKLNYLENHNKVLHYEFVTNFIDVTEEIIKQLTFSTKCECVLSIYGYNRNSYIKTTGKDFFDQFVKNVKLLLKYTKLVNHAYPFGFYMRYSKYEDFPDSEIKDLVDSIIKSGASLENGETINRNWGGLMKSNIGEKSGICSRLLRENGIFTNGDITACCCWDWNKELIIGNVNEQTLEEIYSINSKYAKLLAQQFEGNYIGPCILCDDFAQTETYHLEQHDWTKIYNLLIHRMP